MSSAQVMASSTTTSVLDSLLRRKLVPRAASWRSGLRSPREACSAGTIPAASAAAAVTAVAKATER